MYQPGIIGNKIGSSADNIPMPDDSCDGLLLTCSLEHFEDDVDVLFFQEAERLLKTGGKVVVVPFYLSQVAFCLTDPLRSIPGRVRFDKDIEIRCIKGWGNRHGRFYSPETFLNRIVKSTSLLEYTVYNVKN